MLVLTLGLMLGTMPGLLLGLAGAGPVWAQVDGGSIEYKVKAAFLCKFGNYVEWPAQTFAAPDSPFTIGVVATDEVIEAIALAAAGALVEARTVVVRKLRRGDTVAGVQILFVARSAEGQIAHWVGAAHGAAHGVAHGAAKGTAMLIVTESQQGLPAGSTINFVLVDDRVRFDVALPDVEPGGLRISSRLLGVARKVVARGSS